MKKSLLIFLSSVILLLFAGCDIVLPDNRAEGGSSQIAIESSSNIQSTTSRISRDEAKSIAFKDAGVNESDVYDLEVDIDEDNGVLKYDVNFESGGKEYEYDVNVDTGEILFRKLEKESAKESKPAENSSVVSSDLESSSSAQQSGSAQSSSSVTSSVAVESKLSESQSSATPKPTENQSQATSSDFSLITRDEAKAIAFKDAGVNESDAYDLEIELDRDDGIVSYEIEFKSAKIEYKYDIHAESGKILERDIDRD